MTVIYEPRPPYVVQVGEERFVDNSMLQGARSYMRWTFLVAFWNRDLAERFARDKAEVHEFVRVVDRGGESGEA